MKLARVVGNVVSTVKEQTHTAYKLMIIEFLNEKGEPAGARQIAFDGACAGIGDFVLVNVDGGAAKMLLDDEEIIADNVICGVVDHIAFDGKKQTF